MVSTIYEEGTRERNSFDDKIRYMIRPVLSELNYKMVIADERYIVGMISGKTIKDIINADMMIVDISDNNPNVFYQIAIRNSLNLPLIILKQPFQGPLFDIDEERTLSVDGSSPRLWHETITNLKMQIINAEKEKRDASYSILTDFGFSHKIVHENTSEMEFLEMVEDLKKEVRKLRLEDSKEQDTKMMLKCKHCEHMFASKTQLEPEMLKNYELKRFEKCPKCNNLARYEKENFVFVSSE